LFLDLDSGGLVALGFLPADFTALGFELVLGPLPMTSLRSASSSRQVYPMLVKVLNDLAIALVLANRSRCFTTFELQFPGLASPISVNDSPDLEITVALHMAELPFSLVGN